MVRTFLILFSALYFSVATAFAFSKSSGLEVTEYELDNGTRLIVIPDRRAPVVTHMIWYEVGSADDPVGKSGISHFLEHLMFKGTKTVPQGEFSSAVSEIGGQENAFTSYDYTAYYQKVSPDALETMMTYEADRMRNLVLSDEVVYPERDVILEERSGRVDNSPGAILSEFAQAALFVHHPYGTPIIGWEHEIAKLEREDILAFYERWYQPWNATVVVAGDVLPENVLAMAERTYGKVVASLAEAKRERIRDPKPVVAKELRYSDERVTNPVWRRAFLAPSYNRAEANEGEALDLLAAILGESVTSRIYKDIVLDKALATSAGSFYQGSALDSGYFGLYATPRGETTVEDLETAMEQVIDLMLEEGVNQEELDRARNSFLKTAIFSRDSQVTLARIFGSVLSIGGKVTDVTEWEDRLKRVSVDDVNAVAKKYLLRDRAVTSYLLPKKG
ncbi:MAG: pitrilysin family protein [Rhizobiaceae bacterium]|nr:pitrilysin family protein [Rhizobiaceae bacterium]